MAEKTVYTCDRCGKDIPDYTDAIFMRRKARGCEFILERYLHRTVRKGEIMGVSETCSVMLCRECVERFYDWFTNE